MKLGRGGESITIGQFFSLKGRKAATKHIFVGETRLASKVLPPPGWETDWSDGTSASGPIVQMAALDPSTTTVSGCDPSAYQPQKCPINPSPDPVIDRRLTDTTVLPETYYYHSDQLGSTSWVTDQNGRVHEHVDYFPYGEVWRDPRSDADGAPVKGQQFLFTSREMDEETGLYYFGARYFDPVRVRWASVDPMALEMSDPRRGGTNAPSHLSVYAYSFHNPLRFLDPAGLRPLAQGEIEMLRAIFGDTINYKKVDVEETGTTPHTWAFMNTIETNDLKADYSVLDSKDERDFRQKMTFVHEMAHIWQGQHGKWVTAKGAVQQGWIRGKGFVVGLWPGNSISDEIDKESDKQYYGFLSRPSERLSKYNQEEQASIIEYTYSARENAKLGNAPNFIERKALEIMSKTPEFPDAKALK